MKYTIEYKAKYGDRYYWFRITKRYTNQRRLFQALEQLRKNSKQEYRPVHWYPPKNHHDRIPGKLVKDKPLSFWKKIKLYLYK